MKQQRFKLYSVDSIAGIYATAGDIPVEERKDASDRIIYHIFFVENPGEMWMTFYDGDESAPAICVMGKVSFEQLTDEQKETLRGPRGFKGEKGDKVTLADFTEEEIAALRGRDGEKGEKGDKGDRGDKGMRGDPGLPGEKGEKGDKGDKGDRGEKGEKGDMGRRGQKGDRGMQGNSGVMFDDWDIIEIVNELNLDIEEYGPEAVLNANVGLSLQRQINTAASHKVYLTEDEYDALVARGGLVVGKEYNVYE